MRALEDPAVLRRHPNEITDIKPVKLRLQQTREVALCNCKHSAGKPYCDGTHQRMG